MPASIAPQTRMIQKDVHDTGFLPDWMYYYPDFIHKEAWNINIGTRIAGLDSANLGSAVKTWQTLERFHALDAWEMPFHPSIIDAGVKKRKDTYDETHERQLTMMEYYDRDDFLAQLVKPRTVEFAKKRVVELSSYDAESMLICWLASSENEQPLFMDFIDRHKSSDSFFGERTSGIGNMWDTELHLGFHQVISKSASLPRRKSSDGELPNQQLSNLSNTLPGRDIVPVAVSFRFIGDLRDRFWCVHMVVDLTTFDFA